MKANVKTGSTFLTYVSGFRPDTAMRSKWTANMTSSATYDATTNLPNCQMA